MPQPHLPSGLPQLPIGSGRSTEKRVDCFEWRADGKRAQHGVPERGQQTPVSIALAFGQALAASPAAARQAEVARDALVAIFLVAFRSRIQ